VVVCGGGKTARRYIEGISHVSSDLHLMGLAGISVTRMNARFVSYFFGNEREEIGAPHDINEIKKVLKKNDVVFCGALTYKTGATTDCQAAIIAKEFKSDLVNLTDVDGLYTKNPKKYKDAKFIPSISWKDFDTMANAIKFYPGQHFVIDQKASKFILKNKIRTIIIGDNLRELDNYLKGKKFDGTIIEN